MPLYRLQDKFCTKHLSINKYNAHKHKIGHTKATHVLHTCCTKCRQELLGQNLDQNTPTVDAGVRANLSRKIKQQNVKAVSIFVRLSRHDKTNQK